MVMIGYSIVSFAILTWLYSWLRKQMPSGGPSSHHGRAGWETRIWGFAWPFSTIGIFTWAQLASDRWALQGFSGGQDVGRYAVLLQLGYYPITIASNMAMQLLAPIYYQRVGNAGDEKRNASVSLLTRRLTKGVFALTLVAFTTAFITHAAIFRIVAAREYAPVSYLLPWLILSGGIFAAGQSLSLNLMSRMESLSLLTAKVATSVFAIVLNLAGARLYGIAGVVGASVLFALSYFTWMELLARRAIARPRM
jgi:O-antigen/teichoic acid export membrane protein